MANSYQTLSDFLSYPEATLQEILTELSTTISEFKKNPNQEVAKANGKPFAVLTNNKPTFYVLTPQLLDEMLESLWERNIAPEILKRSSDTARPVKILLNDKD